MSLRLSTQHQNGQVVLFLAGELDLASKSELIDRVDDLVKAGAATVRADLTELQFCDSTGLSGFLLARQTCLAAGGAFTVSGASGMVAEVLKITGLDQALVSGPDV